MRACTLAPSQLQNASQTLTGCLENACPWSQGQSHTSQSLWTEKRLLREHTILIVGLQHPFNTHRQSTDSS